jgi:hypothetical protein
VNGLRARIGECFWLRRAAAHLSVFRANRAVSWVVRWDRLRLARTGGPGGSGPVPGFCGKSRFIRSRTRLAGALSDRIMTGQLLGGKCVAMASALAPAASRNVSPSRSRTSRSVCLSIACAAPVRNPVTERQSRSPVTVSTHTRPSTAVLTVRVLVLPPCPSQLVSHLQQCARSGRRQLRTSATPIIAGRGTVVYRAVVPYGSPCPLRLS